MRMTTGMPRKVLLAITTSDVGGAESFVANLATGLDRTRFAPTVCSLCPVGRAGERIAAAGVPVISLDMAPAARPLELVTGVARLARMLDARQIDLVQGLLYRANMMAALAGRLARRRIVVVAGQRSLTPMTGRRAALGVRFTRWLTRATVANSEAVKDRIVAGEGLDPGRVMVIGNGVDHRRFRPGDRLAARRRLAIDPRTLLVGSVGRLTAAKGFEYLIEAIAAAPARAPDGSPVELALVGDGPLRRDLEASASRLGIGDRVHFLGRREGLEGIYPAFDVFVLSSLREGSPNVLYEAMACRIAAIATDVGGVAELAEHSVPKARPRRDASCLLVPPGDSGTIAAAVERLAGDSALRRRLGAAARARVEAELTIEKMIERHQALYEQLLGGSSG